MAYTAHLTVSHGTDGQRVVITNDRGVPAHEIELPTGAGGPDEADPRLREFGWRRGGEWVQTDDGWTATVEPADQGGHPR